jgi:hypothetical protein
MKKLVAIGAVMGLVPALGLAVGNHPMAGCGLGYLLFSNKDNTKVTQVLGGTTNGTFGSQTFGISSGTSGCTEDGAVKFAKEAEVFAEINLPALQKDIAKGDGEYVTAFATLLGAGETQRPAVVSFLHENYKDLFPSQNTNAGDMLQTLTAKLEAHPDLLG